jgi:hypothetical protein
MDADGRRSIARANRAQVRCGSASIATFRSCAPRVACAAPSESFESGAAGRRLRLGPQRLQSQVRGILMRVAQDIGHPEEMVAVRHEAYKVGRHKRMPIELGADVGDAPFGWRRSGQIRSQEHLSADPQAELVEGGCIDDPPSRKAIENHSLYKGLNQTKRRLQVAVANKRLNRLLQ